MRLATAIALLSLASCASVGERRDRDARDLAELVEQRAGAQVLAAAEESGAVEAAWRELLAQPLSDDSAVKAAVLGNPRVRVALEELGIASAELVRAGRIENPVLSFSLRRFDSGTELEVALVQPFVDLLFLSSRKRLGEAQLAAAKAGVADELVGLAFDVKRALVRVRAAQQLIEIARGAERAAAASYELMQTLHAAGNVTDPQLTAEELGLAHARIALADAEAELPEARAELDVLLGVLAGSPWRVEDALAEELAASPELDHVEQRAAEASFALAQSAAAADAEAQRAGVENWRALLGDVQLGVTAKREHADGEWGLGPQLATSVPLWDFGGAERAIHAGQLRRALALHAAEAIEVRAAARRLHARAEALRARAELVRNSEHVLASRLVRETLRDYNAMQIGVFDVLAVHQRETDAARNRVESLRDARLAQLDLEQLLAGSLDHARVEHEPAATAAADTEPMERGHAR